MIKSIQMFTVICDNCGKDVCEGEEFSCWNESDFAVDIALESDWIENDDKHYCSDCVSYDDNDNLILKQLKEMK